MVVGAGGAAHVEWSERSKLRLPATMEPRLPPKRAPRAGLPKLALPSRRWFELIQ